MQESHEHCQRCGRVGIEKAMAPRFDATFYEGEIDHIVICQECLPKLTTAEFWRLAGAVT